MSPGTLPGSPIDPLILLEHLWTPGGQSRADIARRLNVAQEEIWPALAELLRAGLVSMGERRLDREVVEITWRVREPEWIS